MKDIMDALKFLKWTPLDLFSHGLPENLFARSVCANLWNTPKHLFEACQWHAYTRQCYFLVADNLIVRKAELKIPQLTAGV